MVYYLIIYYNIFRIKYFDGKYFLFSKNKYDITRGIENIQ